MTLAILKLSFPFLARKILRKTKLLIKKGLLLIRNDMSSRPVKELEMETTEMIVTEPLTGKLNCQLETVTNHPLFHIPSSLLTSTLY